MSEQGATFDTQPRFARDRSGPVDLGFDAAVGNPVRERDLRLLEAILRVDDDEHGCADAFGKMQKQLLAEKRRYDTLSPRQREWVEGIAEKLQLDVDDPAERNASVPRGTGGAHEALA